MKDLIIRAAVGLAVVIALGFLVVWLVGGTVGTRIGAWRERREADEFVLDGAQDFDDEPEWYGHDCIAHNVCPLHPGQTATDCTHGCTWLAAEPFRLRDRKPWTDPNDEVTATPEFARLHELEIAELDRPATDLVLTDYPEWRRRLDARRAEKPATDEEYYAADHINLPRQTRRDLP